MMWLLGRLRPQLPGLASSDCFALQVVVVAAGFDTRAHRFGRLVEGVPFFEVDLPVASQ
jgi:O-methyltransferase involved in polyketide biosynthesis